MRRYPFTLVCLLLILWLSFGHVPSSGMSRLTGIDKVVHFGMYFGTAATLWWERLKATGREDGRWLPWGALVWPTLLGGAVEIGQLTLTSYRGGEWLDFLCDALGVVAAAALGHYVLRPIYQD